jgi:PAS domain-containing protein
MLVTPENQMSVNLMFERALETKIGEKQEIRILKPDGASHICLLEVSSLGSESGRDQIHAVLTDISELKQAEQTLGENEEKYRQLFENESDAVMIFDADSPDTSILPMNPAIENLTGWSPSECIDNPLTSFVHPDDFSVVLEMGQQALLWISRRSMKCEYSRSPANILQRNFQLHHLCRGEAWSEFWVLDGILPYEKSLKKP